MVGGPLKTVRGLIENPRVFDTVVVLLTSVLLFGAYLTAYAFVIQQNEVVEPAGNIGQGIVLGAWLATTGLLFAAFAVGLHAGKPWHNALPDGYVIAQLVAKAWSDDPNRIVWPTKNLSDKNAKFVTEQLIADVIAEVKKTVKVDPKYIFTLGWSSGGPPCYVASLNPKIGITGTFIGMSVFKPETLPALDQAIGRRRSQWRATAPRQRGGPAAAPGSAAGCRLPSSRSPLRGVRRAS